MIICEKLCVKLPVRVVYPFCLLHKQDSLFKTTIKIGIFYDIQPLWCDLCKKRKNSIFLSLTLRFCRNKDNSRPQTAELAIWGLCVFSDFVVYKPFWSLRSRDFGPVRTCRRYPSRSRSHGRLRRPKSLGHQALLFVVFFFFFFFLAFLSLGDYAPHLLFGDYLRVGSEPCAAMKVVGEVRSGICRNIPLAGYT